MARKTKMPSEEELPDGPRRKFVAELRRYYRAAGYPPLREVSQAVEKHSDPKVEKVTASAETVRRMITGKVLPVDLDRVYAVFHVLCEMSGVDPEGLRWDDYDGHETNWEYLRTLWGAAMEDDDDAPQLPRPAPPPAPEPTARARPAREDPWASENGYSDEPPF